MRVVELAIAALFAIAGIRSLWKWVRRPFDSTDPVDHVLYAAFVTGRVGCWFSLAGFFLISASIQTQGRAAFDDLQEYRWFLLVPLILVGVQAVAGFLLGRREPDEGSGEISPRP